MPGFFGRDFTDFVRGGVWVSERERERGVDTNRGCNSRQLVARRWRPQAPVIERTSGEQISRRPAPTPGAKLTPSRKIKRRATPPMSTSIHASLDPNSSRANDAREHTANP